MEQGRDFEVGRTNNRSIDYKLVISQTAGRVTIDLRQLSIRSRKSMLSAR